MKTSFTQTLPIKVFLVIGTLLLLNKKGLAQDNCSGADTLQTGTSCHSPGQGANYRFTDPIPLTGARYYRIRISAGSYSIYSTQVMLSDGSVTFAIRSLGNPFTDRITMELASPTDATVRLSPGGYVRPRGKSAATGDHARPE